MPVSKKLLEGPNTPAKKLGPLPRPYETDENYPYEDAELKKVTPQEKPDGLVKDWTGQWHKL